MGSLDEPPVYGEVCFRKLRRKRQRMLLTELFFDFSKNTTLHGLRYVTQSGLEIVEKIFWMLTFFASIALACFFIYNVWYKWKTAPVIVSFSEKHVSVDTVPFPSLTICPQLKTISSKTNRKRKSKTNTISPIFNSTDELFGKYNESINSVYAKALMCDKEDPIRELLDQEHVDAEVVNELYNISLTKKGVFSACLSYMGFPLHCMKLFKKVLTADGVCYNFNGLAAHEIFRPESIQHEYNYTQADKPASNWTLEEGFLSSPNLLGDYVVDSNSYPIRGSNSGESHSLRLTLNIRNDVKNELCNQVYGGYKMYLHHPADLPQSSPYYFAALPGQLSSMALKITMLTTSNRLRRYPLETRNCFFPDEKKLKYFQMYTYSNCKLECLSIYTYSRCNCVTFYMPHNNSDEICGPSQSKCLYMAQVLFRWRWKVCGCLPSCNYISYDAEIHKDELRRAKKEKANETFHQIAKVDIFFKEPMFMSIHRSELFGLTDFLGQCGGLLGLFLGFSFLSLIEILYFITFRIFYTVKMDLKREKEEGFEYSLKKPEVATISASKH